MNPNVRNAVAKKITGMGYGENVVDDEIQAYLSTGIGDNMKRIKDIKQAQIPFSELISTKRPKHPLQSWQRVFPLSTDTYPKKKIAKPVKKIRSSRFR